MSAEMVDGSGDEFKTLDDAAKDFGKEYNGKGIIRKVEVATTFYEAKNKDGESYYSYNEPKFGNAAFVGIPTNLEEGQTPVAIGHTHADILVSNAPDEKRVMREWSSDIRFSGHDIDLANNKLFNEKRENMNPYNKPLQSYLATPNGGLLHYDPNKTYKDVFVKGLGITPAYNKPIFEGLPSDPKSGGLRLNDIDPN